MSLYPTKTRVALLREVAACNVIEGLGEDGSVWLLDGPHEPVKVTARCQELFRAGWVHWDKPPYWRLTDAGRAVLEASDG